jgi:tRNA nucleotidyltransferase (CCA-adding enzyme)
VKDIPDPVRDLCAAIRRAGGEAWLVGGCVRDDLLGLLPKDLDIEVHKLPAKQLEAVLRRAGRVKAVGRSFGVFKLRLGRLELDIGLPQTAASHTPSEGGVRVEGDPWIGLTQSARRRDLTINAIAYDPLTGTYADPYNGRADIAARRLDMVDAETFVADPLRVLRVMQFAARFDFSVTEDLAALCRQTPLDDLAAERVWIEFEKLLLRPTRPSIGLAVARQLDIFSRMMPALAAVNDDALGAALDAAASARDSVASPVALMLSVLLHRCPQAASGILDSLKVFTLDGYPVRARVLHTVQHWSDLCTPATDAALRWLAEDGEIALIAQTALASGGACAQDALDRARFAGIDTRPVPALIQGRDLKPLGIPPGPHMGKILRQVRVAQLDGDILDRTDAIALVQRLWSSQNL